MKLNHKTDTLQAKTWQDGNVIVTINEAALH